MNNLVTSICEKSVQIGMRMIVLLQDKGMVLWPFSPNLRYINLDKFAEMYIEDEKSTPDTKLRVLVAHIHAQPIK